MYRRKNVWYIDKRLPGYGRFGPISTQTKRRQTADSMEAMVVSQNDKGRGDII